LEYIELPGIEERQNNSHPRMTRIHGFFLVRDGNARLATSFYILAAAGARERPGRSAAAVHSA
jgi:hypothetical protein